jgi:hypothetical protein
MIKYLRIILNIARLGLMTTCLLITTAVQCQVHVYDSSVAHESPLFKFRDFNDEKVFLWTTGAMLFSGAARGFHDAAVYHFDAFNAVTPTGKNRNFFDPRVSWKNKYKNGDPDQGRKFIGSTTFLVMFTDFDHLGNAMARIPFYASFTLSARQWQRGPHLSWKTAAVRSLWYFSLNALAFHIVYDKVY